MLNKFRNSEAFTLIEAITAVAILVIAIGIITGFVIYTYRAHGYAFQQARAIGEAQKGIETMVKEIREAISGEDGAYLIGEADEKEFIFYSDVDKDLEVERVKYYVEGTDFIKEIIDPEGFPPQYSSQPKKIFLSHYVRNTPHIFKYYKEKEEEIDPSERKKDTKMIKVYLEININPSHLPSSFILENTIRLRNL